MNRNLEQIRRESQKKIEAIKQTIEDTGAQLSNNLEKLQQEEQRVLEISRNPAVIIRDIEQDFRAATKLTDTDIAFLFLAVALQCLRQYVLKPLIDTERLSDQEAARRSGKPEEHSDRSHRLYHPSLSEIITNPVPFDANIGANGALAGGGKLGHRGATPGHDPILGLAFGTANIATSTLTNWQMRSWHIKTLNKRDVFSQNAKTNLVFSYTMDKLLHQGTEGKILVGASVVKEIAHLRSDVFSTNSLPLPVVSAVHPGLAGDLAARGLDMAAALDAGKQFALAMTVDALIAMVHSLFYDETDGTSRRLYEVRTRRVLLCSNLIASGSNVILSAIASELGGPEAARRITDWGGYLNTLRRIVFDTRFIHEVKRDFLKNELYDRIVGPQYDFVEGG